ncbi:unnamed protein product [Fraxinus pennsylvanica]|uniref:GDSL esterase/lipase 7 n=1 Tax=Fraxinus pennsylvanica TaxID=56036 RepID=A0AAD1YY50_9LAMI|nr:unnamed protein product [Fraxinus pennsylvanica]
MREASSMFSSPMPVHLQMESKRQKIREDLSLASVKSISQPRMSPKEKSRKAQSRAGSTTFGEADSIAMMTGVENQFGIGNSDSPTAPALYIFAEFIGLPYSPPYLSLRGSPELTGLNFASASSGILPETGKSTGKCLNFVEQIDLFNHTVEQELPKHYKTSSEVSDYLSKSVFVITIGSNDYLNYIKPQLLPPKSRYDPQSFAKLLIDNVSQQFQRLYEIGARKIIMFEIGPIGCIPSVTRKFKPSGRCVEKINQLAITFNDQLATLLKNLTSTLQDSEFTLGRVHMLSYDAVINPSNYGLKDSSNPCCITWANGTSGCIPLLPACHEPDKHYFWDGFHVTEAVYKVVGTRCINGTSVCIPKNIKDLVQI